MTAKESAPETAALSEADFDGDLPDLQWALDTKQNQAINRHWEERYRQEQRQDAVLGIAGGILAQIAGHFPNGADAQAVEKALDMSELLVTRHAARRALVLAAWDTANPSPEPSDD